MIAAKLTNWKIHRFKIMPEPVAGCICPESIAAVSLFRGLFGLACGCASQRRQAG